ncbi:hypothetical protein GCM10010358_69050 [Streptomyces minutiscleroticus]|uniref:Uncharacterized protein n=1 Tax=Streptomyces minutiscleroticus TaxID=68238 RepID=A0A918U758_9ACTN|nr:hypothetical protein GCM10010358_69050 [Streptomyces minutiscleroticus]
MPPALTMGSVVGHPSVRGEQNPVVGPFGADDLQGPAVGSRGVEAASEESGDAHSGPGDRSESGTGEGRHCVRGAVIGVRIAVAGRLLSGEGVEESVPLT